MDSIKEITFKDLGVLDELCIICENVGWKHPTDIQKEAIPVALKDCDVIGLAETGSGKTGAFVLPILQNLLNPSLTNKRMFALVLAPTRELAMQIKEQFDILGRELGLKCCAIVGGMDFVSQAMDIGKRPHVIVATPGRLVDHMDKTKGFKLNNFKYLVMDEADRILNLGFEEEVDKILNALPKQRRTMMFSATMTSKVKKLQRVHLKNVVRVEVSSKYQTVKKLQQFMMVVPAIYKNVYLTHLLKKIGSESIIIFCSTQRITLKTTLMLRQFGFTAIPLYGKMGQSKRLASLNKFKSKQRSILLATDVASRGLDIPNVDYVINFDVPNSSKEYIHRVGRTARAGKAGTAITLVSQYDIEVFQRVENVLGTKLDVYPVAESEAMILKDAVLEAERVSKIEMKRILDEGGGKSNKKRKNEEENDDTEVSIGFKKKLKHTGNKKN